jgi:sugar O-acyltransferase (sialic acid O-acetyltransferase NeuD family)
MTELVILGNGGLAREIAWLAGRSSLPSGVAAVLASMDDEDEVVALAEAMVPGVGDPSARVAMLERYGAADPRWITIVSSGAEIAPSTELGRGVVIATGVVVTVDATIGAATMLNLNVTVGHDARIGSACMVNPGANLSGGVTLEDGVLIGTGARILEGVRIGAGARVGAGAVVTRDVAAGTTVVGIPARTMASPEGDTHG